MAEPNALADHRKLLPIPRDILPRGSGVACLGSVPAPGSTLARRSVSLPNHRSCKDVEGAQSPGQARQGLWVDNRDAEEYANDAL